jgi:hypothetical protein
MQRRRPAFLVTGARCLNPGREDLREAVSLRSVINTYAAANISE